MQHIFSFTFGYEKIQPAHEALKLLAFFVGFAHYFLHDFAEAFKKTPDTLLRRFFQFNFCLWFRFAVQVMNSRFRVVAILAFRNESYFARTCIEHLIAEGIKCVVIDNESDNKTRSIYREDRLQHWRVCSPAPAYRALELETHFLT
jgi:hypothetical protein